MVTEEIREAAVDPMTVQANSDFALNLWTLICKHSITRVLESGTYIATGTTAVICNGLAELIKSGRVRKGDVRFITIEGNAEFVRQARETVKAEGWHGFTSVYEGLSIPRSLLPTPDAIQKRTVEDLEDLPIAADHHTSERVYRYYSETANITGPDDVLGDVLRKSRFEPELALLDSGGHMGYEEFTYLTENLHAPCFIAFDDVFHVKHYRSLQTMLDDVRFDIRCLSREKYGFCIALFTPEQRVLRVAA